MLMSALLSVPRGFVERPKKKAPREAAEFLEGLVRFTLAQNDS